MRPGDWERLEAIFFHALDLPVDERAAYLTEACGDDEALRKEIRAVLAAHLQAGTEPSVPEDEGHPWVGRRIGAYLLEEPLGRGGMGEVYRARRADDAYDQVVAVKLLRTGIRPGELARRFRLERQILARLEHPHIATLLDGGVARDGRPYLVMQHVAGEPITEYVDRRRLPLRDRLDLFVTVCRAVQFAHTNLVVHRDLKPSNILVTYDGRVKLLDFGIAKLLDGPGLPDPLPTESLLLLTPEHAAPEQFLGDPVTTATDVYQLGVLLYELLTGTRPFRADGPLELHRAICEEEPTRPSETHELGSGRDAAARAEAARLRRTTGEGLRRRLRGDLDRIVLMALRKEPERRYGSAADLADDVERHLAGYPVRARSQAFGYRAGRFVRRHRLGVAASLALVLSLVALVMVSLRFAATSARQATALAEERDVAVEVSDFLESLFEAGDPLGSAGERRDTLRIRDLLDEGAERVRTRLANRPLVQARLLATLGNANGNLGRLAASEPLLEEAVSVLDEELGPSAPETAAARTDRARVLWRLDRHEEAESELARGLEALTADTVAHAGRLAAALSIRGNLRQDRGRYDEAEADYRRALALAQTDSTVDAGRRAEHLSNLAAALSRTARWEEAEALLRQALELARAHHGPDHPSTASTLNNLGIVLREQERLEEAEAPLREALAIRRAWFEPPHPTLAISVNNLAELLLVRGDPEAAEPLFRESLRLRRELYDDDHPAVGLAWINQAAVLQRLDGRTEESLAAYARARSILEATVEPTHPILGALEGNLGRLHHERGDHATALAHHRAALEIRRYTFDESDPRILGNLSDLGGCLLDLGRPEEAEPVLLAAFAGLEPRRGELTRLWQSLLMRMADLYRALDNEDEVARYQAMRRAPEG